MAGLEQSFFFQIRAEDYFHNSIGRGWLGWIMSPLLPLQYSFSFSSVKGKTPPRKPRQVTSETIAYVQQRLRVQTSETPAGSGVAHENRTTNRLKLLNKTQWTCRQQKASLTVSTHTLIGTVCFSARTCRYEAAPDTFLMSPATPTRNPGIQPKHGAHDMRRRLPLSLSSLKLTQSSLRFDAAS